MEWGGWNIRIDGTREAVWFEDKPLPPLPPPRPDIEYNSRYGEWSTPDGFSIFTRAHVPFVRDAKTRQVTNLGELAKDVRHRLLDDIEEAQFRDFGGADFVKSVCDEPHDPKRAALYKAFHAGEPIDLIRMRPIEPPPPPATDPDLEGFVPLDELEPPDADPYQELFRTRFLCRSGSVMLNGQTGRGKSSLAYQAAILWSIGRVAFGISPTRPLRVLIIQAENDSGDMHEMVQGIFHGCGLNDEDRERASANVIVGQVNDCTGFAACQRMRKLCEEHSPDLVILDPLFAFAGCDLYRDTRGVTEFLRTWLQPILTEFECAILIVHHTTKPPRNKDSDWKESDYAYAGAGVAELANWPRAVLTLEETDSPGLFKLIAAKRGNRLNWRDKSGVRTLTRYVAHATDGRIYWTEADEEKIPAGAVRRTKTVEDLIPHVPIEGTIPKSSLIEKVTHLEGHAKIGEKAARALLDEAVHGGRLFVIKQSRKGTNPLTLISRKPEPETELNADNEPF